MLNNAKLRLITAMLIFGTIGLFVRFIDLPSSVIALARGLVGMLFLLVVTAVKKKPVSVASVRKNALWLLLSGVALGFNWVLLFEAYRFTTVATATLCYYLAPIAALLLSCILYGEKMTVKKSVCALTALVGMAGVSGFLPNGKIPKAEIKGVLFGLAAAALYATVILLNKKIRDISPYDKTIVQLGVSAVVMAVYCLFTVRFDSLSLDVKTLSLLLLVGVVHTGITYLLYFGAIGEISVSASAILSYIDPVTALIISWLVLKESTTLYGVLGAVVVLASALISELPKREK